MNTTLNLYNSVRRFAWQLAALSVLLVAASLFFQPGKAHAAACNAPSTDYGSVTSTVSIGTTGTYRVWSRIMAPDSTNNSYLLEIDGNTCYTVGDSAISANTWTWVDYQSGTTSNKINASLSAGNHTIKMIGNAPDVKLDRVVFTADTSCVPTGTGDNCANPDNPPTVNLTAPVNNATLSGVSNLTATASDDKGVTKVEFYQNFTLICTDNTAPSYTCAWDTTTVSPGSYNVFAKAYDSSGTSTASNVASVTVGNITNAPPATALTTPADNAFIRGTVPMSATASDDKSIGKVEFYYYLGLIGTDSTGPSPYTTNWDTTTRPDGNYAIFTKATDSDGVQTDSTVRNVTIDNTAPTGSAITAPASNAAIKGTYNVTATGTDANIDRVDLFIDGSSTANSSDSAAPYIFSLPTTTMTNGTHTLQTKAYDKAGNSTASTAVTIIVDNAAPTASISAPAANANLRQTYTVNANASDTGGSTLTKVEFYVDGTMVGSPDTTSPYSFDWNTAAVANGTHSLTVKAYDGAGSITTSSAVSITVDNAAPTVSMTAPANGATVSGASVALSATAADSGTSGVNRVEFYRGGALLGSDNTSPYSINWDSTAVNAGSYALTAVAIDNAGNSTTSSTITVTVNNVTPPPPDTTPPTNVIIGAPANGATVVGTIAINATATDNVGVTKIELYIDDNLTGSPDTTAPYSFNWVTTTVADGTHTIKIKAYDAAGLSTTSSAITVTVANAGSTKEGDITKDGRIDIFDLGVIAAHWLSSGVGRSQGDLNNDGVVNIFDLGILAANWGK